MKNSGQKEVTKRREATKQAETENRRSVKSRRRVKKTRWRLLLWPVFCILLIAAGIILIKSEEWKKEAIDKSAIQTPSWIKKEYLTPNPYSRPQDALGTVHGVVVHYVANPGKSAEQNRRYFEGLKDSGETSASSHFIIGLEGEILQIIPLDEIAYASKQRNWDTISIECCHPDATGEFTEATYQSLLRLTAWLCGEFRLDQEDVIRHYDATGKNCPKYYVEHEDAWKAFRRDVKLALKQENKK